MVVGVATFYKGPINPFLFLNDQMAELNVSTFSAEPILSVVWGRQAINQPVFDRWNQGK